MEEIFYVAVPISILCEIILRKVLNDVAEGTVASYYPSIKRFLSTVGGFRTEMISRRYFTSRTSDNRDRLHIDPRS